MFADVPLFPRQASTNAERVDPLFFYIFWISVFFSVLIATLLIVFAVKYRRRSEAERPKKIEGSLRLEIFWTAVPLAIALSIFVWSASVYLNFTQPPANALEIYV